MKSKYIYYIFFTISLFWSCTVKQSYTVKSFFFDGVPDPFLEHDSIVTDTATSKLTNEISETAYIKKPKNELVIHQPFKARECGSCHNRDQMGKLKTPIPELCNRCHKDFNKSHFIVHGPVVSGNCALCHEPHQSRNAKLLKEADQDLCLGCHLNLFKQESQLHRDVKHENCINCHNPHGENNRYLLIKESCYKCHKNYESKFTYLHGPVHSQNCSICHSTHSIKALIGLVKPEEELCLTCHQAGDISASIYHRALGEKRCTECHDPHGGETKNMLKSNDSL